MEELKVRPLSTPKTSPIKSPKRSPSPPLAARVRVAVRVRPPSSSVNLGEPPHLCITETDPDTSTKAHDNVLSFQLEKTQKCFRFDHVFVSEVQQAAEVYNEALRPLLTSLLHGFNVTVLAYGQTGSGKTYTIGGSEAESESSDGLIPHFLRDIFEVLRKEASLKTTAKVSFLEIYCDEIRDLLVDANNATRQNNSRQSLGQKLTIHEDDQDVWIDGLKHVKVKTVEEAINLLKVGRQRQTVGAHALNDHSSRSHAVYTLETLRVFAGETKRAKLTFVDLAGSERVKKTLMEGQGMKEGSHINSTAFTEGIVWFVYFSACISPETINGNETLCTLQYANRARSIQNKAQKNVKEAVPEDIDDDEECDLHGTEREREIYALREQVAALKAQLDQFVRAAELAKVEGASFAVSNPVKSAAESLKSKRRLRIAPLELDIPELSNIHELTWSAKECEGVTCKTTRDFRPESTLVLPCAAVIREQNQVLGPHHPNATPIVVGSISDEKGTSGPSQGRQVACLINQSLNGNEIGGYSPPHLSLRKQLRSKADQSTQYETPLCFQHECKTPIDYVLLSPSQIYRQVHRQKQKALSGTPSPWPHRRRLDTLRDQYSISCPTNGDDRDALNQQCSKAYDVLKHILQCTRHFFEEDSEMMNPEIVDLERENLPNPLSFDVFLNQMVTLYDRYSRQQQLVHRLTQRVHHLASLIVITNSELLTAELSKYRLGYQLHMLHKYLEDYEAIASDRLWKRLQNRESAVENYAGNWNCKLDDVFLSDDQYEACTPWHARYDDRRFFQHNILPFVLNGWISVAPDDLDNEQLWLTL
ncbi:unnamed protein product [Phytophthora fragariaefolia]|uniref:Kinesin-like protein n=1 Tax=Phytophthora fragariaefolia TaxID=1490495 RepID=A0A9W7D258_9STRA|nr:unnamed protein product [Phytophthora fragariaefolia]